MADPIRTEEQKLQAETSTEIVQTNPSVTSSDMTSPENLLRTEVARTELQRLELRQVADLIEALERAYNQKLKGLDKRIEFLNDIAKQLLQLHKMMIQDVEAQFEILKVFQSQLVVLETVRGEGVIPAAKL